MRADHRRQFISDAEAAGFTRQQAQFLWEWLAKNGRIK